MPLAKQTYFTDLMRKSQQLPGPGEYKLRTHRSEPTRQCQSHRDTHEQMLRRLHKLSLNQGRGRKYTPRGSIIQQQSSYGEQQQSVKETLFKSIVTSCAQAAILLEGQQELQPFHRAPQSSGTQTRVSNILTRIKLEDLPPSHTVDILSARSKSALVEARHWLGENGVLHPDEHDSPGESELGSDDGGDTGEIIAGDFHTEREQERAKNHFAGDFGCRRQGNEGREVGATLHDQSPVLNLKPREQQREPRDAGYIKRDRELLEQVEPAQASPREWKLIQEEGKDRLTPLPAQGPSISASHAGQWQYAMPAWKDLTRQRPHTNATTAGPHSDHHHHHLEAARADQHRRHPSPRHDAGPQGAVEPRDGHGVRVDRWLGGLYDRDLDGFGLGVPAEDWALTRGGRRDPRHDSDDYDDEDEDDGEFESIHVSESSSGHQHHHHQPSQAIHHQHASAGIDPNDRRQAQDDWDWDDSRRDRRRLSHGAGAQAEAEHPRPAASELESSWSRPESHASLLHLDVGSEWEGVCSTSFNRRARLSKESQAAAEVLGRLSRASAAVRSRTRKRTLQLKRGRSSDSELLREGNRSLSRERLDGSMTGSRSPTRRLRLAQARAQPEAMRSRTSSCKDIRGSQRGYQSQSYQSRKRADVNGRSEDVEGRDRLWLLGPTFGDRHTHSRSVPSRWRLAAGPLPACLRGQPASEQRAARTPSGRERSGTDPRETEAEREAEDSEGRLRLRLGVPAVETWAREEGGGGERDMMPGGGGVGRGGVEEEWERKAVEERRRRRRGGREAAEEGVGEAEGGGGGREREARAGDRDGGGGGALDVLDSVLALGERGEEEKREEMEEERAGGGGGRSWSTEPLFASAVHAGLYDLSLSGISADHSDDEEGLVRARGGGKGQRGSAGGRAGGMG